MPVAAGASLLSSIWGADAFANTKKEVPHPNSQSIGLLSAQVSMVVVEAEKKGKKEIIKEENSASGEPSGNIVAESALAPAVTPASSAVEGAEEITEGGTDDISVYVVRKGDTVAQIAEMYDVSVNTIIWANELKKGAPLKEGETLLILPIDGVKHTVVKGETLASIAKKYKVDTDTITEFNSLEKGAVLAVGDELIIPDGVITDGIASNSGSKSGSIAKNGSSKVISGYFINPVPELKRKSQGLHGKNGVDLAAPTGTRVLASASGKVIFAKYGWNGAFGNLVIIQHSNSTKTLYAHLSKINVTGGQQVDRGQVVGLVGSTGRSTGPHLHFEVHGAKNPGADWTWAKQ